MSSEGNVIHYVTDKWLTLSIKDNERESRCLASTLCQIEGADQKRPTNWIEALKKPNFKVALNKFLVDASTDYSLLDIFRGKLFWAEKVK